MRAKQPEETSSSNSDPHRALRRSLRRGSTDAERALWRAIRDRQMHGAKFRRQHSIHPYILDFFCDELDLAVELDGGPHLTPEGIAKDASRSAFLAKRGIRVLRFTDREVLLSLSSVLDAILLVIDGEARGGEGKL